MGYIEVFISATLLSLILSFVLIGPVFFLLIETSLTKGIRSAIALDMGVVVADLIFITLSYYGSQQIATYLENHPETFAIGGLIILVFGLFQVFAKGNLHFKDRVDVGKNYFSTFMKGFALNFINLGILVFWLATVIIVTARYHNDIFKITTFFSVLLGVFLFIDLLKILLARKFKVYFTDNNIYKMKKIIGVIMACVGCYLIFKSFQPVDIQHEIDKNPLQKINNTTNP